MNKINAVLFDLDGTLLDTAPDLSFALNQLLQANDHPPLPLATIRPFAGLGGKGLIKLGFNIDETHPDFKKLLDSLLTIYANNLTRETQLFPGIDQVLMFLQEKKLAWGIVTNKPGWLTEPLLKTISLAYQPSCIIHGDTLLKRKPDPAPLIHACELLKEAPAHCVYIGDTRGDIQAGIAAGMQTILALYGYIASSDSPLQWGADCVIQHPMEILNLLSS